MSPRCLTLILCAGWLAFQFTTPGLAQKLASEARGSALSQIVMVTIKDGGCGAGIVVGFDEKTIYVATADHVVTDRSTGARVNVSAGFLGISGPRPATVFETSGPRSSDDLAVIMVPRDAALDGYLDGLNFSMLSASTSPGVNGAVYSIGCWGGSSWASGSDEVLLDVTPDGFRVHSPVNEGQSGGGLFSAAWELIGMPLNASVNEIRVRPIDPILRDLRAWGVPVALRPRAARDRVMGADDLAQLVIRRERSQTLATQSSRLRADNPMRAFLLGVEAVNQTRGDGFVLAPAREALTGAQLGIGGIGFAGGDGRETPAAIDPGEKLLATTSETGAIRIWKLAGGAPPECIKVLQKPDRSGFVDVAFDKASTRIMALTWDPNTTAGSVWSWPLDTPEREPGPLSTPLSGLDGAVTAIAVSPSGDTLAVADVRGGLGLYAFAGGPLKPAVRALQIPRGHNVSRIRFSRDGTVLMAGTRKAWALIWNLASPAPAPLAVFDTGHRRPAFGPDATPDLDLFDLSDDHALLLTGSSLWSPDSSVADPTLRVWRLNRLAPNGAPLVIDQAGPSDPNKALKDAFFLPGQHAAVAITLSGKINTWDLSRSTSSGRVPVPTFQAKLAHNVHSSSLTADRQLLAVGNGNVVSTVRVSDLQRATPSEPSVFRGFDNEAGTVRISPSGRYLFASGIGRDSRLWDLGKIDPLAPSASVARSPYAGVQALRLSASGRLAAVARGQSLELWDIATPDEPVLRYALDVDPEILRHDAEGDCPPCHVTISPDDRWLVVERSRSQLPLAVEIGAAPADRRQFDLPKQSPPNSISFSPDGRLLLASNANGERIAYDLHASGPVAIVVGSPRFFSSPVFSPDGRWICFHRQDNSGSVGDDGGFIARVDALADPSERIRLTGFANGIGSVVFSPDGQWVAIAGAARTLDHDQDDRTVRILRADGGTWRQAAELQPLEYSTLRLVFSGDGRWLFTGTADVTLGDLNVSSRIWDLHKPLTPDAGQTLDGLIWNDKLAAFSPDSQWLVTVSGAEAYGRLWSLKGGRLQMARKLTGPRPDLNNHWNVEFSRDAKALVLWTGDDTTPFLWALGDAPPAGLGIALPNGDRSIEDVRFSPTGRVLTILNSDPLGMPGAGGAHVTFVDLDAFPQEDAYAVLPASPGAHSYTYREDLGLVVSLGDKVVVVPADLRAQLDRARNVLGRNLTWEEWVKSPLRGSYHPTFASLPVGADVLKALSPNVGTLAADGRATEAARLERDLVGWALSLNEAEVCNDLAWNLAVAKYLADAATLSDCALRQVPDDANYRDTRGLVLALSGRREAAIEEFNYFIARAQGSERFAHDIAVRQAWIAALRSGQDPFADNPP